MLGRFTSINDLYLGVQDEIGDDWGKEAPVWETWAKDCLKRIQGKRDFVNAFTVEKVKDQCYIELCDDVIGVNGILAGDQLDGCKNVFTQSRSHNLRIPDFVPGDSDFGNGFLIVSHGDMVPACNNLKWKFEAGNIRFQDAINETEVTVWSKRFKRDKNDALMIPETALKACVVYVCLNVARRTRWGKKENRMTLQDIQYYEGRFDSEFKYARSQSAQLSQSREDELSDLFTFQNRDNYSIPE